MILVFISIYNVISLRYGSYMPKNFAKSQNGRIRKQRLGLALRGASGQYDPFRVIQPYQMLSVRS